MTLPNFLVIGAPKAATTSLDQYLRQHPEVFLTSKGVRFFCYGDADSDDCHASTIEGYEAFFHDVDGEKAIGEVCPRYLGSADAAERIRRYVPDVKLIANLRNPAERAYSGYLMQVRNGTERRPYEQCFSVDDRYVEGGFYGKRLQRFYDRFDRSQIKICLFEDFKTDPTAVLDDIFHFLDVKTDFVPDMSVRHNVGGMPKLRWLSRLFHKHPVVRALAPRTPEVLKRFARRLQERNLVKAPAFPPELRARLVELYRQDIERVQDLVRRDLSHWLT